jgi:deoxyadenosine/deoxycytidine kinase
MVEELGHKYITIEGNIGVGKTTLSHMLAEEYNAQLILEQFTDNPFLPFFYEDPNRYAFPVELFFMTERHKQLQKQLLNRDLFHSEIISDYFFVKTILFAKSNLNEEEYRLFQRLFSILNANFPKPDILVYLHRSVDKLMEQIKLRGREYELKIERPYLQKIQDAYFEYFKSEITFPVLVIDIENMDFIKNPAHYEEIKQLIAKSYPPGLHRVSLLI